MWDIVILNVNLKRIWKHDLVSPLRTILQADLPQDDIEILKPVNMLLSIQRNLSATWYMEIPGIEIKGKLKPMQVCGSHEIDGHCRWTFMVDHSAVIVY